MPNWRQHPPSEDSPLRTKNLGRPDRTGVRWPRQPQLDPETLDDITVPFDNLGLRDALLNHEVFNLSWYGKARDEEAGKPVLVINGVPIGEELLRLAEADELPEDDYWDHGQFTYGPFFQCVQQYYQAYRYSKEPAMLTQIARMADFVEWLLDHKPWLTAPKSSRDELFPLSRRGELPYNKGQHRWASGVCLTGNNFHVTPHEAAGTSLFIAHALAARLQIQQAMAQRDAEGGRINPQLMSPCKTWLER